MPSINNYDDSFSWTESGDPPSLLTRQTSLTQPVEIAPGQSYVQCYVFTARVPKMQSLYAKAHYRRFEEYGRYNLKKLDKWRPFYENDVVPPAGFDENDNIKELFEVIRQRGYRLEVNYISTRELNKMQSEGWFDPDRSLFILDILSYDGTTADSKLTQIQSCKPAAVLTPFCTRTLKDKIIRREFNWRFNDLFGETLSKISFQPHFGRPIDAEEFRLRFLLTLENLFPTRGRLAIENAPFDDSRLPKTTKL